MNILFISGVIPKQLEEYVINNTIKSVEFAANKYQQLMIKGLKSTLSNLTVLNSMFVNSFPRGFKKPYIYSFSKEINENREQYSFINTGFLNIFGIRHFSKCKNIRTEVDKWTEKVFKTSDNNCIIGYSVFGEALYVFKKIKKTNPEVQTCLVVPDLPKYCRAANKLYNHYLLYIDKILKNSQKYIDKYILFSKHMAKELGICDDKYIVVEGICDELINGESKAAVDDEKLRILYTGGLEEKYGVVSLCHAIESLNNDKVELHICGSGSAESYLSKMADKDNNIVLHGKVSNKEAIQLQINSDILVNPRTNEGNYTRFSFPSKTMEYLVSGTPMIGYKLDGIPDEYDQYITYVNGTSVENLADTIRKMIDIGKEQRDILGKRARKFIIEQKNPIVQMQRVEDFLKRR